MTPDCFVPPQNVCETSKAAHPFGLRFLFEGGPTSVEVETETERVATHVWRSIFRDGGRNGASIQFVHPGWHF
jgi:hypothetical protein